MAHNVEPMDIDTLESDFDNKENSIHHSNIYPRTPCTEKGYEELDVSELNMKLRYSVTPASSPMSKSFTANCVDSKNLESKDDTLNANLTRSYNSAIYKSDVMNKSVKTLPLQELSTEQLRPLDSTMVADTNENVSVTITGANNIDDHFSLPSSSSSVVHTPEVTTPTKDIPKDGGSPIMRGLKSVLNMFRSSQSPIPPNEGVDNVQKDILSPDIMSQVDSVPKTVLASTPIASQKNKDGNLVKRNSPHRESIVFNEDLEKELLWKDETTILFSEEKIPIHKLFYQQTQTNVTESGKGDTRGDNLDSTVEYMDISYNDSVLKDRNVIEAQNGIHALIVESDSEFVDCETTFTEDKSQVYDNKANDLNTEPLDKEQKLNEIETNNKAEILSLSQLSNKSLETSYIITQPDNIWNIESNNTENVANEISSNANTEEMASETLRNEYYKLPENIEIESKHSETYNQFVNKSKNESLSNINNMEIDKTVTLHNNTSEITTLLQENKNVIQASEILSVPVELSIASDDHSAEINTDTNSTFIKSQNDCFSHEDVNNLQILEKEADNVVLPANVPLPDEDDIENEKSLGVDILEPLNTLPANMNVINNETMEVKLENTDLIECMPIETHDQANFTNVNKTMNISLTETTFTDQNNITLLSSEESKTKQTNKMDSVENELGHYKSDVSPDEIQTMKQEIAMDINEIILNAEKQVLAASEKNIPELNSLNMIQNSYAVLQNDDKVCGYNINMDNLDSCHSADDTAAVTDPASYVTNVLQQTELESHILKHSVTVDRTTKQLDEIKLEEPQLFENKEKQTQLNKETYDKNVLNSELNITSDIISDIDSLISETNDSILSRTEKEMEGMQENLENKSKISYTDPIITQSQSCEPIHCKAENDNLSVQEKEESNSKISYINPSLTETIKSVPSKTGIKTEAVQENLESKSNISDIVSLVTETSNLVQSQAVCDKGPILENLDNKSNMSYIDPLITQTSEPIQPKAENEIEVTNDNQGITANIADTDSIKTKICEPIQSKAEIEPIQQITESRLKISDIDSQIPQIYKCKADNEYKQEKSEGQLNISVVGSTITCEPITETIIEKESIKEVILPANIKEINQEDSSESNINNEQQIVTKDEIEINIDEEIIVSENDSPYVSVAGQLDSTIPKEQIVNTEEMEISFAAETKTAASPPISPKIISKGYNFNFDEIDDPFATKTKIRTSPTPESPKVMVTVSVPVKPLQKDVNKNRRKSQPERKKPIPHRKKINNTFSGSVDVSEETCLKDIDTNQLLPNILKSQIDASSAENVTVNEAPDMSEAQSIDVSIQKDKSCIEDQYINNVTQDKLFTEDCSVENSTDVNKLNDLITKQNVSEESKCMMQSVINTSEGKNTSSSEQSFYYSAGTSSGESIVDKNVFNIPEINDSNFNPFITKSKMRQTPSPPPNSEHKFKPKSNSTIDDFNKNTEDKIFEPLDEKESVNISNTTCSSKTTDEKDVTVREVNTEDEDTVEGPFLEADLNDDKMSDFDGEDVDMMQFSELPTQTNEEDIDSGELFIDAEAFEFLLNQNKSSVVTDSGKESLFLKFDPLFAKRVSTDGVLAALNKVQKRQSTPKKESTAQRIDATFNKSIPGPSTSNMTQEIYANVTAEESSDDLNITVSKPMMVVTPAVNPIVTPRNKTMTPTSSNRRSITFTSPAIAVIDRLLSLSGNNSMIGHDSSVTQVSREQNEADLALTQLRELLAEKEISVYNLRSESKELKDRLTSLESQMQALETESEERLRKVNELNQKLSEKTKLNKSMAAVVEEYERTIASLIAETEQDKKRNYEERIKLVKERDEQTAHLASMEVSFSDLHSKYEKSKQIILTCKANEDAYKKSIKDFEENLSKMQSNYELLKQHATSKLNHANQELEKMNRAHEAEVLKLSAMIKRKDLHITSLEETLAQKTKANEELTAICDELINKVG